MAVRSRHQKRSSRAQRSSCPKSRKPGLSLRQRGRTVNEIIASKLPVSCRLAGVAVLVALVVGAVQLTASMNQYNQELETLTELKRENAKLEHAYRTALDLDTVQEKAEAMGMIPAEEAEKMTVRVSVPEHEEEPTAWENFLWFLSGLLGPAEEPES